MENGKRLTQGLAPTQSSEILAQLADVFSKFSDEEKKKEIKKVHFLSFLSFPLLHMRARRTASSRCA